MDAQAIAAPLLLTVKVALCATLAAVGAGVGLAWVVARRRFPGREVLDALLTLPLVLPPTVLGYYLLVLVGRRSAPGRWLEELFGFSFVFHWQGAVLAAAVVSVPIVFKAARAAFEGVSPDHEMAARTLPWSASSCASRSRWPGAASSPAQR
jgi:molybdate transport system permease protein